MQSMKAESILSLSQYLPSADALDEPDLMGREAARQCGEALVHELLERGYPRTAVIEGLKRALSTVENET